MSQSENHASDTPDQSSGARGGEDPAERVAVSTVRIVLALVGLVLLLFALGQAVGLDILGMIAAALSTPMGQWLVVAVFALFLIVLALRGFGTSTE